MMILFLGNSIEGILADARRKFPSEQVLVVKRDGDRLQAPEGVQTVEVSKFQPEQGVEYVVVANGGTAIQLATVLVRLFKAGASMRVYDVQRDGTTEIQ